MITFIKQPRKKDNLDSFDSYTFYKNGVENNMITINILLHTVTLMYVGYVHFHKKFFIRSLK